MKSLQSLLSVALVLVSAWQAVAEPPIIVLPSSFDSQLVADYDKSADSSKACDAATLKGAKMWPPTLDSSDFLTTFSPGDLDTGPTCWWHMMQLQNETQGGGFVSSTGVNVTTKLTVATSAVLPLLAAAIRKVAGYKTNQIFVLPYDWRLDVNSMQKGGQLQSMASRIIGISGKANEKVIFIGYSQGNVVALKLLQQMATVRKVVKGYIALAAPFGGATATIAALTSGSVAGIVHPALLKKLELPQAATLSRENLLYTAVNGMASLAMMFPSIAAFPYDPTVVTAGGVEYTVRQIPQLLRDIGQPQLADAYDQLEQADITGPFPDNIPTYCIYGSGLHTRRSFNYSKAFEAGKQAEEPHIIASVRGDRVVGLSSLMLCNKLTTPDRVFSLPAPITHFNVFSHPLGRAALAKSLQDLNI